MRWDGEGVLEGAFEGAFYHCLEAICVYIRYVVIISKYFVSCSASKCLRKL